MKKLRLIILLSFLSLLSFSQTSIAKWRSQTIAIDGSATDWSTPLRFFDSNTKLFFAFANDSTHLYICFQCNDERYQAKINRAGMKVSLSTKSKEKHKASVEFPLTDAKLNFAGEEINEETKPDIGILKHTFILQNVNMLTKGFATQNGTFPIKDSTAIKVALNWNEKNTMTYELAIPLKEILGANYTEKDLTKDITMLIEVNAITQFSSAEIDASQTAMGSASGQSGGMTRTMPNGTGMKQKNPLYDKNKVKQKFVLAKKP